MRHRAILVSMLAALAGVRSAPAADGPTFARLLELIPADVEAFVAVPNLDRTGDRIDTALLAMDRADMLVGSRPVDLVKSTLGMNSAVDDFGAGAIALLPRADGAPFAVLFVPVTSVERFLGINFQPGDEPFQLRQADGTTYWHRDHGTHVLLARDPHAFDDFDAGAGIGRTIRERLGEHTWAQLARRDVLAFASPAAAWHTISDAAANDGGGAIGVLGELLSPGRRVLGQMEGLLWSIEFDPLALVIHERIWFRADTDLAVNSGGGAPSIRPLAALADRPHAIAASFDFAGAGGRAGFIARTGAIGLPPPPAWLDAVNGLQFGVYDQRPDGSGMLGDAYVILDVNTGGAAGPETVARHLVEYLEGLAERDDGIAREVTVAPAPAAIGEGVVAFAVRPGAIDVGRSPLDAYFPFLAGDGARDARRLAFEQVAAAIAFGPRGWQGYLGTTRNRVVIALGRRPELWAEAVAAAEGRVQSLDENFIVQTMRDWMPPVRDVEVYVQPGRLLEPMRPLLRFFNRGEAPWMPALDPALPPLGFAADVDGGLVRATTIVPNGFIAIVLDRLAERVNPVARPGQDGQP